MGNKSSSNPCEELLEHRKITRRQFHRLWSLYSQGNTRFLDKENSKKFIFHLLSCLPPDTSLQEFISESQHNPLTLKPSRKETASLPSPQKRNLSQENQLKNEVDEYVEELFSSTDQLKYHHVQEVIIIFSFDFHIVIIIFLMICI
eukprot:TRINITY_DN4083_c0_g1_i1.p1 TRINITY_DN4083_c0_g1~~TRINITY_DN4083_c0_g1_i1.p1  ORF type:complete len:146 (-),score=39.89 TRINITY_DN4083_c0_g1_i1:386-823(-)